MARRPAVEVAVAQGPFEAGVVRALLESYGIEAELVSNVAHSVWPVVFDEAGLVHILVAESEAEAASELIAGHRRSGLVAIPGGRAEPRSAAEDGPEAHEDPDAAEGS